jgi:LmbE family N-acetylglucosaminyl deacetylase
MAYEGIGMALLNSIEAFAETQRLIIVAAHPDDLESLCGATVYKLNQRGVKIFSVNCTLGDIGTPEPNTTRTDLASTRLMEAQEAARILGISRVFNLGHHDGELVSSLELRAQIAHLYRVTQADTLFTFDPFWSGQIHPDHRAAGQAAIDAYMPSKMPLYHPEQLNEADAGLGCLEQVFLFSTDRDPGIYVDISDVYDTKLAACMVHRSQFPKGEESLTWMKELDERQGKVIQVKYAEVYKQINVW